MALCSGIRTDGARCRAQAMRDSTYCLNHAPNAAELRKRRAWRGGKAGGKGRPNTQVQDVKEKILELTEKVEKGDVLRGCCGDVPGIQRLPKRPTHRAKDHRTARAPNPFRAVGRGTHGQPQSLSPLWALTVPECGRYRTRLTGR